MGVIWKILPKGNGFGSRCLRLISHINKLQGESGIENVHHLDLDHVVVHVVGEQGANKELLGLREQGPD